MIFYTLDNEYRGNDYFNQRKITRNVFCYYDTMLLQSRLYPNNDESKKTQYREIVQNMFSVCDSIPNLWIKKPYSELHNYYTTHYDSKHYPDYEYDSYNANISLQKDFQISDKMIIGSTCYCLECGEEISEHEYLYCDYRTDDKYNCGDCGCRVNNDDAIYIDGDYYCRDCVGYCERCHEYVNGLHVCEGCLSEHYIECGDCGDYINKDSDDCYYIDGDDKHVCYACYKDYFCCEECGDYYSNDDECEYNGMTVYRFCYDSLSENDIDNEDIDNEDIAV